MILIKEIETWSDRRKDDTSSTEPGTTILDPKALYLDQAYFPSALWGEVFEAESSEAAEKRKQESMKRKSLIPHLLECGSETSRGSEKEGTED